jgi:hypothetical protein
MKKLLALTAIMALVSGAAFAGTDTHNATASASVSSITDVTVNLFKQTCDATGCNDFAEDIADNAIAFGALTAQNGVLNAGHGVMAYINMNVSQQGNYTLTQNIASSLTAGSNTIPNSAFKVTLVDLNSDNPPNSQGQGQILQGGTQTAVGNLTFYNSGAGSSPGSKQHTIRAYYGLSNVPIDQPAGSYSTNVVYTLTV